jgi:hypothetical protein
MLTLCLHKNHVRFDFRIPIRDYLAIMDNPTLDDCWSRFTGYHTSETAKLAFTLQYLALDRQQNLPRYHFNPDRWVKPEPRDEQKDGPKRRRFKNRDRHSKAVLPLHKQPGCTCSWCRNNRKETGPAPDNRRDREDAVDNVFAVAREHDDALGLPTSIPEVDAECYVDYCDECGYEFCVCGWNCDEDDYDLGDPNERIIP